MNPSLPAASAAPIEDDDPTVWRTDDRPSARPGPVLGSATVRTKPGRPRRDDRPIFDRPIWLARTGGQWAALPRGFGPKSTVPERCAEWVASGALERAWAVPLAEYDAELGLDW